MAEANQTISDRIRDRLDDLTRAERQLALSILENYPVSGLGPLAALAKGANVSVPTVARMVQADLRDELGAMAKGPIAKQETWAGAAPSEHILNTFTDAVIDNIRNTMAHIDPVAFDEACALVADQKRHLYIVGGRITHTLAEFLFMHMQVIRPNLTHVQSTSNTWPHYLLNAEEGDVFVIFDVRRYENNTLKLAEMARARGAKIVLFTDQWRSPVHHLATISLTCRIIVPSAWDSVATTVLLVESMISQVQTLDWSNSKNRMQELEDIFDKTKLFRKFT